MARKNKSLMNNTQSSETSNSEYDSSNTSELEINKEEQSYNEILKENSEKPSIFIKQEKNHRNEQNFYQHQDFQEYTDNLNTKDVNDLYKYNDIDNIDQEGLHMTNHYNPQFIDDSEKNTINILNERGKRGRRKIPITYIQQNDKRNISFAKRRKGIMKKAYELSILTGSDILLIVSNQDGQVFTFSTPKLRPVLNRNQEFIKNCLYGLSESVFYQEDENSKNQEDFFDDEK